MTKRDPDRRTPPRRRDGVPDLHLWHDVARSVSPLARRGSRPHPRPEDAPLPVPGPGGPPPPRPVQRHHPAITMPAYQSAGHPARPPGHGIEPNLRQRLQRGRIEIDATLDLHGMRQAEAHAALGRFVRARAARGDRTILVITGKGLKKVGPDAAVIVETGVLRAMLPVWLSEPGLSPLIAGWEPSARGHGGDGAFYVRLRRAAGVHHQ